MPWSALPSLFRARQASCIPVPITPQDASAFFCMMCPRDCSSQPNPVQLEFNTDENAKSSTSYTHFQLARNTPSGSPSAARTVALEDNCLQPVCTFVKIVERAVAAQGRVIIGRVTLEHPKDPNSDFILKPSEESLQCHEFRLLPVDGQNLRTLSRTTLVACEYSGWPDIDEHPSATFKASTPK